jgi:hypothetical protein
VCLPEPIGAGGKKRRLRRRSRLGGLTKDGQRQRGNAYAQKRASSGISVTGKLQFASPLTARQQICFHIPIPPS